METNPFLPIRAQVSDDEFPVWLADTILNRGVAAGATDIHINPVDGGYKVSFRVDGAFRTEGTLESQQGKAAISRMKVMARLKTYVNSLPQEGRIALGRTDSKIGSSFTEARISIFPTVTGEKAVVRLFGAIGSILEIRELGLPETASAFLEAQVSMSGGVLAVCGPSGSGKTTTLYSILAHIHKSRGEFASIATLEDPVERVTGLFAQTEVNENLPFHRALPGLLRQDPEVIMIGEIRDAETAKIAFEAGLTGHLILTSMHCDDASGAMLRIKDLGVPDAIARPAINGILAMRLLRKVCGNCGDRGVISGPMAAAWDARGWGPPPVETVAAVGCPECGGSGYRGLAPVCQVVDARRVSGILVNSIDLPVCGPVRLVSNFADSLRSHLEKGVTTIEECFRVFPYVQ